LEKRAWRGIITEINTADPKIIAMKSSRIRKTTIPINAPGIKIRNRAERVVPTELARDALSRNEGKKIARERIIQILNLMRIMRFSRVLSTSQL
jgi:hypothetical protein